MKPNFSLFKRSSPGPLPAAIGIHPDASFHGEWRPYQERVLRELEFHLEDHFLHVVAAPGAGKTVLGLEVIQRLGHHAVILTPRTAIREQWIDTFSTFFLSDTALAAELVSSDIEDQKPLTVLTYQSLVGSRSATTDNKSSVSEAISKLARGMREPNVKTLVLDESHHLTEAWGAEVQTILELVPDLWVVSLTATTALRL